MKRLTFFVKGNVDVRDSLHFCRIGGELVWNGINEVLRRRRAKSLARVKHETWTRSDALLECGGTVPAALAGRDLPLGAYSLASQFSNAVFTTTADAIFLSIQPDVTTSLMRHRRENFLFYPSDAETWATDDQVWLRSNYETNGLLSVDIAMRNLAAVVAKIRCHSEAPILIYNLSPVIPGEQIHCYAGLGETFSNRIRKFNLALAGLSTIVRLKKKIPEDVAIISFDESEAFGLFYCPITHGRQPLEQIGKLAVNTLLNSIAQPKGYKQLYLESELIIGKSCAE